MAESDVFVRFGADIEPLKKGAQDAAKSIGAVSKQALATAKDIAKVTLAAGAAGAALVAMASSSAVAARGIRDLSMVSGTGVKEFQNLAFAAKSYGIEQDKLADIFKDTQDKVGDFLQNGAGPLADFFDNIAPKVGVTATEFKGLSGPDALGLYVSSLEKANLSQSEMVFYMEAIASDATNLLPLLRGNGAELQNLASQADSLGISLSALDIAVLDDMQKSLDAATGTGGALVDKLGVEFAPIIEDITNKIMAMAAEFGGVGAIAQKTFDAVIKAAGYAGNTIRGIQVIIKGLEIAFSGLSLTVNVFATKLVEAIDEAVQYSMATVNNLIDTLNKIPSVDIGKLVVGKSQIAESMRAGLEAAKGEMATKLVEMQELLMEPLPSEAIEAYVAQLKNPAILEAKLEQNAQLKALDDSAAAERIAREEQTQSAMAQIRQAWGKQQASAVSQMFGDLSTLMQSGSKKQFEIGKAAARAQTVMSTYEGAQKAYTSLAGIPIVGPALGAAAAAAAVAAGGIRLQAINSTSFGSGSVSAGASGSASAGAASPAQAAPQPEQNRTVRIEGFDSGQLFTGDQLNSLAQNLVEYQDDGFKLVV